MLQPFPAFGGLEVLVAALDHPEGVALDPSTGELVSAGEDGHVWRIDPEARSVRDVARVPGQVLGVAVDGRGRIVACCSADGSVRVIDTDRTVHELVRDVDGEPLDVPNYPSFGPDGSLYVSASGTWGANDGRIVRVDPDGGSETLTRRLDRFPNGSAVTPDGTALWVVESFSPTVNRVDLRPGGGVEVVARLDGTVPDGVVLTDDGGLLVTCYRPDRIYHVDASGRVAIVADDPQGTQLAAPTNACFFGPGLDRLAVANLGRWHLTLLRTGLRGVPLHRPERWAIDALL